MSTRPLSNTARMTMAIESARDRSTATVKAGAPDDHSREGEELESLAGRGVDDACLRRQQQ